MLDTLKVWWVILTQVGPIGRSSRAAERWMRYYVIEVLREEGLFDYLQEARNYGQIIAHFSFVDSPYTREVLETLAAERDNVLVKEGDRYRRNPGVLLPTLEATLLHWTPDPARAIQEMGRVLKPGGLVFGTQVTKPLTSPYIGLIVQVRENVYGFFCEEEFRRWYERAGVALSIATPAGVFKGHKRGQ